jgi:hypothetical protein
MTCEQDSLAMHGAAIVATQLGGDYAGRDVLITMFVRERGFPSLVEAFSYAAIAAITVAADAQQMSFQAALDVIDAQHGEHVRPGMTVPWAKAVRLVAAAKSNERDVATIRSTMDVHSAVRATFQLAFTAFLTLVDVTGLRRRSAEEWATAVSTGRIELGSARAEMTRA